MQAKASPAGEAVLRFVRAFVGANVGAEAPSEAK